MLLSFTLSPITDLTTARNLCEKVQKLVLFSCAGRFGKIVGVHFSPLYLFHWEGGQDSEIPLSESGLPLWARLYPLLVLLFQHHGHCSLPPYVPPCHMGVRESITQCSMQSGTGRQTRSQSMQPRTLNLCTIYCANIFKFKHFPKLLERLSLLPEYERHFRRYRYLLLLFYLQALIMMISRHRFLETHEV